MNRPLQSDLLEVKVRRQGAGVSVLQVKNRNAVATVSLFGGQVLTWQPLGALQPVLWLSEHASMDGSKAIRGGVPVCWPWFGAHPDSTALPAHGYARIQPWRLESIRVLDDGDTELTLSLDAAELSPDSKTAALHATQVIRIGPTLELSLTTTNTGATAYRYTEGLHTYFKVSDIANVKVTGLNERDYFDLTRANERCRQIGGVTFDGELGRLFTGTTDTCVLHDSGFERNIRVEKSGSLSTAIWNPGLAVASRMSDLGEAGWREMACVESANAADDAIHIEPGAHHTMFVRYAIDPFTPG